MKGASLFLICVLLIVLAIPLFADHALGNTVGELSAISTINNEEVNLSEQEPFDLHIAVLNVGLRKSDYLSITESKKSVLTEKTYIPRVIQQYFGGVRRANKLGRH